MIMQIDKSRVIDLVKNEEGVYVVRGKLVERWEDAKGCSRGERVIIPFNDIENQEAIFLGLREKKNQANYLLINPEKPYVESITIQYSSNNLGGVCLSNFQIKKNPRGIIWNLLQREIKLK